MPLARAYALITARTVREGQKLPGMSYADMDLNDAIEKATDEYNLSLATRHSP